MILLFSLLVIAIAVLLVLYGSEVRLTLLLAAVLLASLVGEPLSVLRTFLDTFASEQFLVPIGCCMGFAFVLRHTECDQHLVHLLSEPLQSVRPLLLPGSVLVGVLVNIPLISQASTAVTVGAVLVPILRAARYGPVTIGATLAMGCSIGGELLNPGAPELRSILAVRGPNDPAAQSIDIVRRVLPLLLVHLAVAVPLFWWLSRNDFEENSTQERQPVAFHPNWFKAFLPLLPVVLLFLTALPPPFRLITIPPEWLLNAQSSRGAFDSRLVGAAMLIGTLVVSLSDLARAWQVGKVFFEGAGYALTHITSLIIAAKSFGDAVARVGLGSLLGQLIDSIPSLLWPMAALLPMGFGWVCGSGMASTESLYRFYDPPAMAQQADPLQVGALVSLAAATGRTLSPVAAVVLMAALLSGATPLAIVRRITLPLLAGLTAATLLASALGRSA
ncbi:MAG: C4-dicarboxylate transporter DcuC [Gemmataceae bacterium]